VNSELMGVTKMNTTTTARIPSPRIVLAISIPSGKMAWQISFFI
jgi:hypothetical protein